MATSTKSKTKQIDRDQLKEAYLKHLLLHGEAPKSVYAFANDLKSQEADFYKFFNSFTALEKSIWSDWFVETTAALEKDEAYVNYTVREKLLSLYYTWLEALKQNRSYVVMRFGMLPKHELHPDFLEDLRHVFKIQINDLLMEGKDTLEVAERPFASQYDKAFWFHFLYITRFWVEDTSSDFEKTDAAIEKSVNLAFDLVGKGALDSMIDFGKFLFQNRK